jgi:hypothetical protein
MYLQNVGFVDRWPLNEVQLRCPEYDQDNKPVWADLPPYPTPPFVPQGSTQPDIHPGKYNPLPFWPPGSDTRLTACQWQNFALAPPMDLIEEFLDESYKLGYADANAWAMSRAA